MEPRRGGLAFHFGKGNNLFCTVVFAHAGQRSNVRLSWEFAKDSLESLQRSGHGDTSFPTRSDPSPGLCFLPDAGSMGGGGVLEVLLHLLEQTQGLAGESALVAGN